MITPRPKKILFSAYAFYPAFGGLEQQMYLLAQNFIARGYQVDILTEKLSAKAKAYEIIDGMRVFRMPYQAKRTVFAYLSLIWNLSFFILQHRSDYQFAMLRAALTLYPLVFGFWKFLKVICYCTYVTADTGGDTDEIIILKRNPFYRLMLPLFASHTYLNSICATNYEHYLELGFPAHQLTKIPNGVDIEPYQSILAPKKIRTFLFAGRFIKQKGIYELVEAFVQLHHRYPDAQLLLAGDGPEKSTIFARIHDLHAESFILDQGIISAKQKRSFYESGDCLVLPSYSEGYSLVAAEAAVHKRVILITDVADIKKVFGTTVFYVKKRDVSDLVQQMEYLMQMKSLSQLPHLYDAIIPKLDIRNTANQILELCRVE